MNIEDVWADKLEKAGVPRIVIILAAYPVFIAIAMIPIMIGLAAMMGIRDHLILPFLRWIG